MYVDRGKYFVINRGRQYGKTTTLQALTDYLNNDYTVVSIDFQGIGTEEFVDGKTGKSLRELFVRLSNICAEADSPIVLIIDEVDSASNNQVFIDFLAQLRGYYLKR